MDKISDMAKTDGGLKLTTPVMVGEGLTKAKQIRFVSEYCVDFNGAAAAVRAGYAAASAKEIASELLTFPNIKDAVARRMEAAAAVAEVDTAFVVKELYDVATADPRDHECDGGLLPPLPWHRLPLPMDAR
jgi:phage terminase small subunit